MGFSKGLAAGLAASGRPGPESGGCDTRFDYFVYFDYFDYLVGLPRSGGRQGQRTSGGSDIRIASTLPPVIRPNLVPRSCSKLNST